MTSGFIIIQVCEEVGLLHTSKGQGKERYIEVSKKCSGGRVSDSNENEDESIPLGIMSSSQITLKVVVGDTSITTSKEVFDMPYRLPPALPKPRDLSITSHV